MKVYMFLFLFLLLVNSHSYAQRVKEKDNIVTISGDTVLFFDSEGNSITKEMHSDSLKTGKYIVSIKGTDEKAEIHLTYKHPNLKSLIGKKIKEKEWSDLGGKTIKISNSPGYTIISFWNRHCRVCVRELTALDVLVEEYPNVDIIALTPDSFRETQALMKRLKLDWENVIVVPDDGGLSQELQLFVYPTSLIVENKERTIESVIIGGSIRELLRALDSLSAH